jgi:hypothetical protein
MEAEQSYRRGQKVLHGEHGYEVCGSLGLKLLKSAADKGHCDASHIYGQHLNEGKLCDQNAKESQKYIRRSADLGNPVSEFRLGVVHKSSEKIRSLKRCSDHGNALAQLELAKLAGKQRYFDEFGRYSQKAADQGNPLGFVYWSLSLSEGWGTPKNSSAPMSYLSRAVKLCSSYRKGVYTKELEVLSGFADNPRLKATTEACSVGAPLKRRDIAGKRDLLALQFSMNRAHLLEDYAARDVYSGSDADSEDLSDADGRAAWNSLMDHSATSNVETGVESVSDIDPGRHIRELPFPREQFLIAAFVIRDHSFCVSPWINSGSV